MDKTNIRVAAISGNLDWSLRHTCSNERYDPQVARWYVKTNVQAHLRAFEAAVAAGAKVIVGPEYFTGSEMFTASESQKLELVEAPDGPTSQLLCAFAAKHDVTLAMAYDMRHGEHMHQTGILVTPDGVAGLHVKHNRGLPSPLPETLEVYDTPHARAGVLVCSDCQDPNNMLDMTSRGMNLLLLPGAGFYGAMWREVTMVRAMDQRCPIIYSDDGRAMITDHQGKPLAETQKRGDMIVATVTIPQRTINKDYWSYFNQSESAGG